MSPHRSAAQATGPSSEAPLGEAAARGSASEAAEGHAERARLAERLEEAERLSTQRAAAAAAERREVATLRGLLEAATARHEARAEQLAAELAEAQAQVAPVALSARQLPALMDALEVCQRERHAATTWQQTIAMPRKAAER